jgi:hypothetical protein
MRKQFFSVVGLMVMIAIGAVADTGRAQTPNPTVKLPDTGRTAAPTITIEDRVALASLITISDGHLIKIADEFKLLSTRKEVVAGDWVKIKELLAKVSAGNVQALMWFAHPSGKYRTVQQDLVNANIKSRPYFSRVMAGKTVVGDLVVSKSTGKNVTVVAVPVFKGKRVVGVLGCSVYLDKLSERIKGEMELPANMIFYSFDATPLLALVWDQGLIFSQPKDLGEEVDKAFREMLNKDQGAVTYSFRGKTRNVIFKKSPVTSWWYAIGLLQGE